jgi:hypothetical protein
MRTWIANYEGNEIRIENSSGFFHETAKLFVNNKLQDEQGIFSSSNLTGHVISDGGERKPIKVNVYRFIVSGCWLFVDDEKVEVIKTS